MRLVTVKPAPEWLGPFKVKRVVSDVVYELDFPLSLREAILSVCCLCVRIESVWRLFLVCSAIVRELKSGTRPRALLSVRVICSSICDAYAMFYVFQSSFLPPCGKLKCMRLRPPRRACEGVCAHLTIPHAS